MADDEKRTLQAARNFIIGKLYNERSVINRAMRDYAERLDTEKLCRVSEQLKEILQMAKEAENMESLRGNSWRPARYAFHHLPFDIVSA